MENPMNKNIMLVSYLFLTSLLCRAAEIKLENFKPDSVIQTGVENLLIAVNTNALNRCIDMASLKISEIGELVIKRDSVLKLDASILTIRQFDPEQAYVVLEYFKFSHDFVVFSYAMKSGIATGNPQHRFGILKKITGGWKIDAFGIFEPQIQDTLGRAKN